MPERRVSLGAIEDLPTVNAIACYRVGGTGSTFRIPGGSAARDARGEFPIFKRFRSLVESIPKDHQAGSCEVELNIVSVDSSESRG